jgi:hypothetical protein
VDDSWSAAAGISRRVVCIGLLSVAESVVRKNGWLLMAWILIGIGILGTFAAPAGSLEGFIYTTTPFWMQVRGYLEIVSQALLLSALLC